MGNQQATLSPAGPGAPAVVTLSSPQDLSELAKTNPQLAELDRRGGLQLSPSEQ